MYCKRGAVWHYRWSGRGSGAGEVVRGVFLEGVKVGRNLKEWELTR